MTVLGLGPSSDHHATKMLAKDTAPAAPEGKPKMTLNIRSKL